MNARVVRGALCVLLALLFSLLLFFPLPSTVSAGGGERYRCVWADGAMTEEGYASALRDLAGWEDGELVLLRDGLRGEISAGGGCNAAAAVLTDGTADALFGLRLTEVSRLERAALYRTFSGCLWYADGWYGWTGDWVVSTEPKRAETVSWLTGELSSARLSEVGARTVRLLAGVGMDGASLLGTQVERVVADSPYRAEGETICLVTPGGVRLVGGLPQAVRIEVPEDVRFADEGALLACTKAEELVLPFLGSARSPAGSAYRGELAHLFSTGEEYRVPATLRRVRVKGGALVSHAFYACPSLEEIDACGVAAEDIEPDAFADCMDLRLVHTPRSDVRLAGTFTARPAPCGCTVYVRADTEN